MIELIIFTIISTFLFYANEGMADGIKAKQMSGTGGVPQWLNVLEHKTYDTYMQIVHLLIIPFMVFIFLPKIGYAYVGGWGGSSWAVFMYLLILNMLVRWVTHDAFCEIGRDRSPTAIGTDQSESFPSFKERMAWLKSNFKNAVILSIGEWLFRALADPDSLQIWLASFGINHFILKCVITLGWIIFGVSAYS